MTDIFNNWLPMIGHEILNLNFWGWLIVAAILIIIELLSINTLTLWLGVAAGIVAFIKLFTALPQGWDWIVFAGLSFAHLFVIRRLFTHKATDKDKADLLNRRGLEYVGQTFLIYEPVKNNKGRLLLDGVWWIISGPDCKAGTYILIIALEKNTLKFRIK